MRRVHVVALQYQQCVDWKEHTNARGDKCRILSLRDKRAQQNMSSGATCSQIIRAFVDGRGIIEGVHYLKTTDLLVSDT